MSSNELEYEYESYSDDETDVDPPPEASKPLKPKQSNLEAAREAKLKALEAMEAAKSEEVPVPQKKVKKPLKPGDKRSLGSSAENLKKGRATRLANIHAQKLAALNQYEIKSSSDEDEDTEPVLTRQKKPIRVDANSAKMIELEAKLEKANLLIDKLALQAKLKKQPKVIQVNVPKADQREEPKQAHPDLKHFVKRYLDL
jgi:hypothetical protein